MQTQTRNKTDVDTNVILDQTYANVSTPPDLMAPTADDTLVTCGCCTHSLLCTEAVYIEDGVYLCAICASYEVRSDGAGS